MSVNDPISTYNQLASRLLITHLYNLGCRNFFISPGSRSTPITLEIAKRNGINKTVHFDERGAAFAALGSARAALKPSVLICTSGTAGANYYPAVIEAFQDRIPLIILTADRPPELQNVNSNQTINQLSLFGTFVRHFENFNPPDKSFELNEFIKRINYSFSKTEFPSQGPVHLNFMFREPLVPEKTKENLRSLYDKYIFKKPVKQKVSKISKDGLNELIEKINESSNVIVVCGYQKDSTNNKYLTELSEKNNWIMWNDVRSTISEKNVYFDLSLLNKKIDFKSNITVLHFGGNLTSKRYLQFIESSQIENYYHFDTDDYIYNPHHKVTKKLTVDIKDLTKKMLEIDFSKGSSQLKLNSLSKKIDKFLEDEISTADKISEISISRLISKHIKIKSSLFLASSMPIRDYDMFSIGNDKGINIFANRGASGIDGAISSFYGTMTNSMNGTAILGDLSFLHDLNSLTLFKGCKKSAVIVLINNSGGGIFSFLPVLKEKDTFEKYFAASHDFDFSNMKDSFDFEYYSPVTNSEFVKLYGKAQSQKGLTIIEVKTDRNNNLKLHNKIYSAISKL